MKDNNLLSIESLVDHVNEKYDFCYESEQFRKANYVFYDKLKEAINNAELAEDMFFEHEELVNTAEKDYFKAGFSAGVQLILESLGANI